MTPRKIAEFAVGPLLSGMLALGTIPVLAWSFAPEDLGRNNIYQICLTFSVLLCSLGLDQAYVREYYTARDRHALFKTCFVPGFSLVLILASVFIYYSDNVARALFNTSNGDVGVITAIGCVVAYCERFFSLALRMQEKGVAYSIVAVLPKTVLLIGVAVLSIFSFDRDFESLSVTYLCSLLVVVVVLFLIQAREIESIAVSKVERNQVVGLVRYGFPLIVSGLAYWGLGASTSLILREYSTLSELGIYAIALSISGVASIFQNIFTAVWMPTVFKWAVDEKNLSKVDGVVRHVAAAVSVGFAITGLFSWVVEYLFPKSYTNLSAIIGCVIAQPLLYTLSETTVVGISIAKKSSYSMAASGLTLIVNIIACACLVPSMGAAGAAISTVISYYIFLVLRTEFSALVWRSAPRSIIYIAIPVPVIVSIISVLFGKAHALLISFLWVGVIFYSAFYFKSSWILAGNALAKRLSLMGKKMK